MHLYLQNLKKAVSKGILITAEWSFEGETDYPVKGEFLNLSDDGTSATVEAKHTFSKTSTYFAILRIKSNREGDSRDIFTQVKNLCRVRVIVK